MSAMGLDPSQSKRPLKHFVVRPRDKARIQVNPNPSSQDPGRRKQVNVTAFPGFLPRSTSGQIPTSRIRGAWGKSMFFQAIQKEYSLAILADSMNFTPLFRPLEGSIGVPLDHDGVAIPRLLPEEGL